MPVATGWARRLKWELEDLAFKVLEPESYGRTKERGGSSARDREDRLAVTCGLINGSAAARSGATAR